MFPSASFNDEAPVEVDTPILVEDASPVRSGTLGTYVLSFTVAEDLVDVLSQWSGDAYALWEIDDQVCLTAEILMDNPDAASRLGTAIAESMPDMSAVTAAERLTLHRCLPAN